MIAFEENLIALLDSIEDCLATVLFEANSGSLMRLRFRKPPGASCYWIAQPLDQFSGSPASASAHLIDRQAIISLTTTCFLAESRFKCRSSFRWRVIDRPLCSGYVWVRNQKVAH